MSYLQSLATNKAKNPRKLWFERLMAMLATANLGLVLFDLSYISGRNFWLNGTIEILEFKIDLPLPTITKWYDPVKGIEPHRDTQKYLNKVRDLEEQVAQTGLQSAEVKKQLAELDHLSTEMIETNPFQVANKSGTLEKIKNKMRDRLDQDSAKKSFSIFWSQSHLSQYGWQKEIEFFTKEIVPLLKTNYYRPIGENGEFIDYFWIIDLPFVIIFGLEFLGRTFYISRRQIGVSWFDAMLWRWYDIFLLIPLWRWLRVVPVVIRLDQAQLLDLARVREQANQGFVATFAEEITEVVVVRVIKQIQGSIEKGDVSRWLFQPEKRAYIDLNNVNELEAIANIVTKLVIYQVLPKIKPDIEAILHHNIESVIKNLPAYKSLQNIPGVSAIPTQLTERLVKEITQGAYEAIIAALEDPVGAKLSNQLIQHFGEAIAQEAGNQNTVDKIQNLIVDMLEELKINYVERLSEEDVEQIMEETRQIRQLANPKEILKT